MPFFKQINKGLFLVLMLVVSSLSTLGQMQADLSKTKSSQITDAQLNQFLQQAQMSGMSEDDLLQEFQKRGLPESEIKLVEARLKNMIGAFGPQQSKNVFGQDNDGLKKRVSFNSSQNYQQEKKSRVFGAELFSGSDPLFVPTNLKLATPRNYIVGVEDELQVDIYGDNISSQKLTVSPDGFVNVRYAGPVNINGMSIEQVTGVLKARLTKYYPALKTGETKIQVSLSSVRSIQVSVIGAVKKPGTVTLPSIAKLFNALYASGGPLENGSLRNIELIRDNKVIVVADLYDFILKGSQASNLALRENDVIRVPFAKSLVILEGGLNRTGIFEMKESETLENAFDFAGGFRGGAFKERVTGTRYTDVEKKVIDISKSSFSQFKFQNGDSLYVDTVVNRFENRVYITGAIFKPGAYALESQMDVKGLIQKAQGLKEDAFLSRANMVRLKDDFTKEYKTVDLRSVIGGNEKILLRKEDSIHVVSVLELRDSLKVGVYGPVKKPGEYFYQDSMTLQSLILEAGGFLDQASLLSLEIGRKNRTADPLKKGVNTSEIISIDLANDLTNIGKDIVLQPFDIVSIKYDPTKVVQTRVTIKGEIKYSGEYILSNPDERLTSLINRAGGLLPYADINGVKLIRKREKIDTAQLKRLAKSSIKLSKLEGGFNDTTDFVDEQSIANKTTEVAVDLIRALRSPGSVDDIALRDGDELIIPKFTNTISIEGEVLKPVTVQFESNRGFGSYISDAGGFTRNAYKRRAFVVYPNGRSAKTKGFLGVKLYPKVIPGSSIFVPVKADAKQFDPAKLGVIASSISAIMTALVILIR